MFEMNQYIWNGTVLENGKQHWSLIYSLKIGTFHYLADVTLAMSSVGFWAKWTFGASSLKKKIHYDSQDGNKWVLGQAWGPVRHRRAVWLGRMMPVELTPVVPGYFRHFTENRILKNKLTLMQKMFEMRSNLYRMGITCQFNFFLPAVWLNK